MTLAKSVVEGYIMSQRAYIGSAMRNGSKKSWHVCPPNPNEHPILEKMDLENEPIRATIRKLVQHHVAVTSTLVIFETFSANRPPL